MCKPFLLCQRRKARPAHPDVGPDAPRVRQMLDLAEREPEQLSSAELRQLEAFSRAHGTGYLDGMAEAARRLGTLAMEKVHHAEAETRFHLARRLAWEAGNERLTGSIDLSLGALAVAGGDLEAAIGHYRRAQAQFQVAGDDGLLGHALRTLGQLHVRTANWSAAEDSYQRASEVARRAGDMVLETSVRIGMAELRLASGDLENARAMCDQARTLAHQRNDVLREAMALKVQGGIARAEEAFADAASNLAASAALAQAADDRMLMAEVACEIGELHCQQGHRKEASEAFSRALDFYDTIGAQHDREDVKRRLASLAA